MNKLKRPPNGRPDNRFLERDQLERELVTKDKQTLITDCLKIFDVNTLMFEQAETAKAYIKDLEDQLNQANKRILFLECRTVWQVINTRLEKAIEKIRKRKEINYPTP